jgi:hypothetical protein
MKYRLSTVVTDVSTAVLRSSASTAFAPVLRSLSTGLSTPHSSGPNSSGPKFPSSSSRADTDVDVAASLGSGLGVCLYRTVGRTSAKTNAVQALFVLPAPALRADNTVNAASAFSFALTNTLAPVDPFSERAGVQFVARWASFVASPMTEDLSTKTHRPTPICTAPICTAPICTAPTNSAASCHKASSAVINIIKSTYSITPGNEVGRPDEARPLSLAGYGTAFLAPRRPSQGVMIK